MPERKRNPTQQTQPKKGKPVEIPVPKRSDFDELLDRAEKRPAKPKKEPKPTDLSGGGRNIIDISL
jgi:hypothetical protein